MHGLIFLLSRSLKNGFLRVVKKPASLIGYLFFAALMLLNVYNAASNEMSDDPELAFVIYLFVILVTTGFTVFVPIYQGTKRFTWNFLPADAPYLMSGPYKARYLLVYAQIKQSAMLIWISLFLGIQIPMFSSLLHFDMRDGIVFILGFVNMTLMATTFGLIAFVYCQKGEKQKLVTKIILAIIVLLSIIVMLVGYQQGSDMLEGAKLALSNELWIIVPGIGWIMSIYGATVTGVYGMMFVLSWIFVIVSMTISFIVGLKYSDDTFYEDAISNSIKVDKIRRSIKEGHSAFKATSSVKKKRVRRTKFRMKRDGMWALFDKRLLEANKKGLHLLDFRSLLYIGLLIGGMYLGGLDIEAKPYGQLLGTIALLYIMLIFQMSGRGLEDLELHYIYMMPYNNVMKLLTILSLDLLKTLIEVTIGLVLGSLIFGYSIITGIMCGVIIVLYNYCFNLNGIIGGLIFGKIGTVIIRNYLRVLLNIVTVLPGIFGFIGFMAVNEESMDAAVAIPMGLTLTIVIMFIISVVLSIPASLIVSKPEYNS